MGRKPAGGNGQQTSATGNGLEKKDELTGHPLATFSVYKLSLYLQIAKELNFEKVAFNNPMWLKSLWDKSA
jgi:hypothetical protein